MTRHILRLPLVVAVAALIAFAFMGPASAQTFRDPAHDGSYSQKQGTLLTKMDISRVVVTNGKRVKFTMGFYHLTKYNFIDRSSVKLGIDTNAKRPGAEYRISGKYGNISYKKHGRKGYHNVGCVGGKVHLSFKHGRITFNLRRACIGNPHRIRVRLVTGWINPQGYRVWDTLPASAGWTRWVRH